MTYALELSRGGVSALAVAMRYGVPVGQVMRDREEIRRQRERERLARKNKAQIEFLASDEPFALTMEDLNARLSDEAALAKWLALPIRYENHPERPWNAGAAARNDAMLARRRSHHRTLGGVADYSSVPEAA